MKLKRRRIMDRAAATTRKKRSLNSQLWAERRLLPQFQPTRSSTTARSGPSTRYSTPICS
ncbi:unnamed protein product [Linum tenue]|uniref:Uncharacterized protein n=1 Tax=Linum tenue TaxID=586396 RepID=A0AAV0IM36_9ROSI|nr:unnamed protein product [Linum tenue]